MNNLNVSVLFGRMNNMGMIHQDTQTMAYYTDILNRISPNEEELSISWVENLLNPHPKTEFSAWRARVTEVNEWIIAVKADEELSKDLSLMMDLDQLLHATINSCKEMAEQHAIPVIG